MTNLKRILDSVTANDMRFYEYAKRLANKQLKQDYSSPELSPTQDIHHTDGSSMRKRRALRERVVAATSSPHGVEEPFCTSFRQQ